MEQTIYIIEYVFFLYMLAILLASCLQYPVGDTIMANITLFFTQDLGEEVLGVLALLILIPIERETLRGAD